MPKQEIVEGTKIKTKYTRILKLVRSYKHKNIEDFQTLKCEDLKLVGS